MNRIMKQRAKPTSEAAERQQENKNASTSEQRGLQQNGEGSPPPSGGNWTTEQGVRFRDKVVKASVMKTPTLTIVNPKEKKSRKRKQPPDGGGKGKAHTHTLSEGERFHKLASRQG